MLRKIFEKLDEWMQEEDKERREAGGLGIARTKIRLLGQMALIEARLDMELFATVDVDVYLEAGGVRHRFGELLKEQGLILDPDSDRIWMPAETEYLPCFSGGFLEVEMAKPEYIMVSKALKAPEKNANLITDYLAMEASENFFALAKKYKLNLERFL